MSRVFPTSSVTSSSRHLVGLLARAVLAFSLLASLPAWAHEGQPFIDAGQLDLLTLLAPPPANNSPQMQAELAEILSLQVTRTPAMVARAQADSMENVWRFGDVMGERFVKDKLPLTDAFFQRVGATEGAVVDPYKNVWKRPRPYDYSDLVKPATKLSHSGSYPSGHATNGTLTAIVLANMVPEKRAEIMARGLEYANNRVVAGVHYRSDVEAGRIAGTLIAARLQQQDDFRRAFEAARAELREVLGLPVMVGK